MMKKRNGLGTTKMKKVSVAMAVYNGEKYLIEQLESIIKQLGPNDELVISYDESSDNTLKIISDYSEKYRQIRICRDTGKGVFSNFENAIKNCRGDYIFISDQDDVWVEGKKAKVLADLERGYDMVIHNAIHIDSKGKQISNDFFTANNIKNGIIRNYIKPRYSGCCIAFSKELKRIILPIPRKVGAYDHWIGMVGELYGRVYFENGVFLKHRLHGENVTVSTRKLGTIISARYNLFVELCRRRSKLK